MVRDPANRKFIRSAIRKSNSHLVGGQMFPKSARIGGALAKKGLNVVTFWSETSKRNPVC